VSIIAIPIESYETSLLSMVTGAVKDTAGALAQSDFDMAINNALARYSKDRPRTVVGDIAGAGVQEYALPTGWVDGLSVIEQVEYPAGQIPEVLVDSEALQLYRSPSGLKLRLIDVIPGHGETVRVQFTAGHDVTTVPGLDAPAVANLAASTCCRQLAQIYGQTSDPSLQADSVNYRSKGDEFARRAKELEGLYRAHIGVRENDTTPASSVSASSQRRRRGSLTHGR
jgi:hypothetical protein